jgi:hypothetical protein
VTAAPATAGRAVGRLARAAAAVAALAALAALAPGAAAAGPLAPVLVVRGFGEGDPLLQPRGVAFDPRDGAIYVANTGARRVDVFSRTGRPLARFVHRVERPDGTLADGRPCALAFDRAGRLLVADQEALYVDVLDRRGRALGRLDPGGGHPAALAVAPDGSVFVGTAVETSLVVRFDAAGRRVAAWGDPGGEAGRLRDVTALALLPGGELAVACAHTDLAVQVFSPDGAYLRGFGAHEMGRGNLSLPSGLLATADGRIWVLDEIRQDLQVFDPQGRIIEIAGGHGAAAGEFARPSSLGFDGVDRVAITDLELGRVQVLAVRPNGRLTPIE